MKGDNMPTKSTLSRRFNATKHSRTRTSGITCKAISIAGQIKDPTGIAGSWSDNRSAEEIIANIHDSRKSKR
jgi:hypothetical protein